jgi:STE24 endopeptidase
MPANERGAVALDLFDAEQVERARRYHRPLYLAALTRLALEVAALGLLAFSRLGAELFRPLAHWPWWAQVLGYSALIDAVTTALSFPFSLWSGFVREHRFGFSTQSRAGFAADQAKAFALRVAFSATALLGLVAAARLAPRLWPLPVAAAGAGLVLLLTLLAPLLLEPLFNRFEPLADRGLAAELEALAERAGTPVKEVLVADASRRTRKANAYVSGLGATRRLVLYDTLLEQADAGELAVVLAHELGHRRARHLLKGVVLAMAGLAMLVALLWALLLPAGMRAALGAPAGARDPRIVAFVALLGALLPLFAAPFEAALSRRFEREADRFSLELTGDLPAFVSMHRGLARANLADLDPPRAIYLLFFSHPTPAERIGAARELAAER